MRHVREQLRDAIVARIGTMLPAFVGGVWAQGSVGWDRRTHPVAFVTGLGSKVSVEPGSDGRMQRRDVEVLVEVADCDETFGDYVERIGILAASVEGALDGLGDDLPIESVSCLGDTGVQDVDGTDERGVYSAIGLTFTVGFYTETGNACDFIAPRY